jgi:hypothetical protein
MGSAGCSVTITGRPSWRVETCGPWLNRVVQDDLMSRYHVGSSFQAWPAFESPAGVRTPRQQASRLQPCLGSRKAEGAAAARNLDFAGCRGNQAAELAAGRAAVQARLDHCLVWARCESSTRKANQGPTSFVPRSFSPRPGSRLHGLRELQRAILRPQGLTPIK